MGTFADKFESEEELRDWIVSFYEEQLLLFFNNIGGVTKNNTKITSRLIKTTMKRYQQLLDRYEFLA